MTPRQRTIVGLGGGALLAAFLFWGALGLPGFGAYAGPYGDLVNAAAPAERQVQNVVTAINFDYRALDTLAEEYILFAAVAAAALLLRRLATEHDGSNESARQGEPSHAAEALHAWGLAMVACTLVFGVYMVVHAVTSPGGGFQGGCVLASAWVVVFLTGETRLLRRVTNEHLVQFAEAAGAGAYAATGVAMLVLGGAFLENMLPLGTIGSPLGGGMMLIINAGVGLEVTAGFVLILLEFLRQTSKTQEDR